MENSVGQQVETPSGPWYKDPSMYERLIADLGLSEREYSEYTDELLTIYVSNTVEEIADQLLQARRGLIQPTLYPAPWSYQLFNPLPFLLSRKWPTHDCLIELLRLGRDLRVTRSVPGKIKTVRNRLKVDSEYIGALFEIEVLSEFARAGLKPEVVGRPDCKIEVGGLPIYVEMRHRGVPFGMAVVWQLRLSFAFLEFGTFNIHLKETGSTATSFEDLSAAVSADAIELLQTSYDVPVSRETTDYVIHYDPHGERCKIAFSFGEDPYDEQLQKMVVSMLKDKEMQLERPAGEGHKCLIAVDFRSVLPSVIRLSEEDARLQNVRKSRAAIVSAVHEFLAGSSVVDAVLTWWRKADAFSPVHDKFRCPFQVSLITIDAEIDTPGDRLCEELAKLF